jgi:F-type H+-transporting ATPase subunit delta
MTSRSAATRYARALFDVLLKERGDLEAVERQLAGLVDLFSSQDALRKLIENPAFPTPRKRALVAALLGKADIAPVLRKLVLLLAERDRLVLAPMVLERYRERLLEHRQVVRAEVTTVSPLPPDRSAALKESLARVTGKQVVMTTRTDPALLGGLVARVGSTVYDGSLKRQLDRIRQTLLAND